MLCACVALGTLILLLPALTLGRPFIFWDTSTFYDWGRDIVAAIRHPWPALDQFPAHRGLWAADNMPGAWDRITPQQFQLVLTDIGARSKFYAVPLYLLGSTLTLWAPAVAQAALVAWMLWVTASVTVPGLRPAAYLGLVLVLTAATTAPFYAAFLMPDVFAPLGLLAAALLMCFPAQLTPAQRAGSAVLVAAAALVHISNALVMLALVLIAAVAGRFMRPPVRVWRGAIVVLAALLGAAAVAAASDAGTSAIFGLPVETAPFLEGRVIADGPGQAFLRETCARHAYEACRYKDLQVLFPDDIIWPDVSWHHLPLITDPAARHRFLDEQGAIVLGTLVHHPLAQLRASLRNAIKQLADFRIADSMGGSLSGLLNAGSDRTLWVRRTMPNLGPCLASRYAAACDERQPMRALQTLQFVGVAAALALLVLRLLWWRANPVAGTAAKERRRLALFVLALVGAVIANGVFCGATSGAFERYQARVIWLVPMLAALVEMRELRVRNHAAQAAKQVAAD